MGHKGPAMRCIVMVRRTILDTDWAMTIRIAAARWKTSFVTNGMSKPVVSWFHGVGMAVTMKPWFRGFMVAWHISPSPPWNQVTCFVVSWLGPLHHWDIRWRSVAPSSSPPEEVARHLLHTFKRETLSPRFFLLLPPDSTPQVPAEGF